MPADREVEVTLSEDEAPVPVAFRIGSRRFKVAEQMDSWSDRSFAGPRRGRDWRQHQERWYYRVRTEEGEVYELYTDWSPGRRHRREGPRIATWHLHRRLISASEGEAPAPEGPADSAEGQTEAEGDAPTG